MNNYKLNKIEPMQTRFWIEATIEKLISRRKKIELIAIIVLLLFANAMNAQTRATINEGVDKYKKGDFAGATENFKKSINEKFENYQGHFNLGDALYKQEKYKDALSSFKNAMALAKTDEQKAEVYHNVGNSLLKSKKLKEAIGAYSESLKLNPNDLETKYNLSYALKQMQKQKDKKQNKNDKNKKDKKNDKKNDQNKDQNKKNDKKDKNKNKNDKQDQQNQDKKNDKKTDQQLQNQKKQPPPEISKEEAQRILNALKDDEAQMQKELRKKKGKKVKVEKDW